MTDTYFYSDSHNDIPLLEKALYPVAVDPDPILTTMANAKNWPIISLR
jgi:phosphoserine phosphatase